MEAELNFLQGKLTIIDAANNKISKLDGINHFVELEDLWVCLSIVALSLTVL